jgi:hypothetical protein
MSARIEGSCWPSRTKSSASSRKISTPQNAMVCNLVEALGKSLGEFQPW